MTATVYDMGDGAPIVQELHGGIALWGDAAEDGQVGFRLSAEGATTLAIRLLAQVSRLCGDDIPITPASAFAIDNGVTLKGDRVYRVGFQIEEGIIAVQLDADQFSDTAAAFAAEARLADRVRRPRPDSV